MLLMLLLLFLVAREREQINEIIIREDNLDFPFIINLCFFFKQCERTLLKKVEYFASVFYINFVALMEKKREKEYVREKFSCYCE